MSRLAGYLPLAFLLAAGLTAAPRAPAATAAPARLQMLLARMHQAYSRSQWKEYRAESADLLDFLNGSPDALLEVARASARTGDLRTAMQDLQTMARMGLSQPRVVTLADFGPLRDRSGFRKVVGELAANAKPISRSHQAFVISDAGQVIWEPMGESHALQGTDGLYWYQGRLLAVQNGLSPERVLSFTLDARRVRITAQTIIESGTPTLDPTHGVIVSGYLYYITNSGWNALAADGTVRRGAALTPAIIMRTRL
jgi:hypothetical protein